MSLIANQQNMEKEVNFTIDKLNNGCMIMT